MKVKIKIQNSLLVLFCVVTLFLTIESVMAQEKKNASEQEIIVSFLNASEELHNSVKYGFTSHFTGEFRTIPNELQSELSQNFPEYKFYIAKMLVLIDPPLVEYDLILITNASTAKVEGFIWGNYWMIRPSKSFEKVLKSHQAKSEEEAISQMKTFAKLIVFTNNDQIGNAKIQNGKVKVELIRGKGVFSILEVEMNKCLQFDRLTITQPNGEKLKYFV